VSTATDPRDGVARERRDTVGSTKADNVVVVLPTPHVLEPDYSESISGADLVATLDAETEPMASDDHVDVAPRGDDVFGF
jgi:hypothetical protein